MRSYGKEGVVESIRAAGGEVFAVSSEPQALADRAAKDWELDFETIGDPHHEIAGDCRARGWLDLFVNERLEFLRASASAGLDWEPTHIKGYFQPGVLAVSSGGRVLYRWRGVPTHQNMGGATERPTAGWAWSRIEASLAAGEDAADAALDANPELDTRGIPWAIFAPLLVANGWFVSPRGFRSPRRVLVAAGRLLVFALAWALAFAWLPFWLVAAALAAWVAWIVPKLRWLGREFQDASAQLPHSS